MKSLLDVFLQPGKLFAGLHERRGAWIAPLIANALLVLFSIWLVPHYIGRENVARQQLEGFASRMTPGQMQESIARSHSAGSIYAGYAMGVVGTAVVLLIISGILLAFGLMTSAAPRFSAMFSMVSLAFFPYWLVTTAMTALILMTAPDPSSLDVRNLIATNVAAFVDKNSMAKGLYSLLSSLDILSFGEIGLLAFGFSKLTRASLFFGLAAVLGMWILYVSAKMALSLLF